MISESHSLRAHCAAAELVYHLWRLGQNMYDELENLKKGLIAYIEATYHISNSALVMLRKDLLEQEGTLAQLPYIESTPK